MSLRMLMALSYIGRDALWRILKIVSPSQNSGQTIAVPVIGLELKLVNELATGIL